MGIFVNKLPVINQSIDIFDLSKINNVLQIGKINRQQSEGKYL